MGGGAEFYSGWVVGLSFMWDGVVGPSFLKVNQRLDYFSLVSETNGNWWKFPNFQLIQISAHN